MKQSVINFRGDAVMDVTQSVVELMNNNFIGNGTIMTGMGVQQAKVLTSLNAIAYCTANLYVSETGDWQLF